MPTPTDHAIDAAVAALRRGECIGLPTETVYGLAADAGNPAAVRRIFALKGRPADHPLIVHLPSIDLLDRYAREVSPPARRLAEAFWPGPLTLILPKQPSVPDEVTGGQDSVGLRVPAHPLARRVLAAFGSGLAAPSANRFGRISPTRASHVIDEFGAALPIVLDGGDCELGIESTIVAFDGDRPRILRPGSLEAAAIESVAGPLAASAGAVPRASGTLDKHYAPRTPMQLATPDECAAPPAESEWLARGRLPPGASGIALPADAEGYARGLYAALRELDARAGGRILLEPLPDEPRWTAVRDRLRRAVAGAGIDP